MIALSDSCAYLLILLASCQPPSDTPRIQLEALPSDYPVVILGLRPYQTHLKLSDEQRLRIEKLVKQLQDDATARAGDVTLQDLVDKYAEQLRETLTEPQRADLTKLQRFIKFYSPFVSLLHAPWLREELKLSEKQRTDRARRKAESLLRMLRHAEQGEAGKSDAEVKQFQARERELLSNQQRERFDQIYLQQQTWLHGPGALLSDAPQLAPLKLTDDQRNRIRAFRDDWRAAQGKPTSLADLIANRHAGLQRALALLDEDQQTRWLAMVGRTLDWKLHFGLTVSADKVPHEN
ncbi:MAG: hypothetical protein WD049_09525 [Candidatus Paceibacterota bacterium]